MLKSVSLAEVDAELAKRRLQKAGGEEWLASLFPQHVTHPFASHHDEFWDWVWSIQPLVRPRPFVACWPRGAAKSTSGELAQVALGARNIRKYCLYISETQDQADDHVGNVGAMMESQAAYPELGEKLVSKHGMARGWRRNRLRAANGFTIDALGLDTASRGMKLDEQRPDAMWFDDIDSETDTLAATEKKITTITRKLLPAGAEGMAVLFIQNLVKEGGVMDQLIRRETDFLGDAIISGPIPALKDMVSVGDQIISGDPTWQGQDLDRCRQMIDDFGMRAFMAECQHDVGAPEGGMFNHIDFRHIEFSQELLKSMDRVVCWVDPAVSDTDRSDANGIQITGIKGRVRYPLFSWEQRASPLETLKMAIKMGIEYGVQHVGVETDQGGDLWKQAYQNAARALGVVRPPPFRAEKAGAGFGSKQSRAQRMLVPYERSQYVHVVGGPNGATSTHGVLEKALRRFPITKPHDLVDANSWCEIDLNRGSGEILHIPHPTRSSNKLSIADVLYPDDESLSFLQRQRLREYQKEITAVNNTRRMIEKRYK